MNRVFAGIACAAFFCASPLAAQKSLALRDVLTANHVAVNTDPLGNLDQRVASLATHDSSDAFTMAYYTLLPDPSSLNDSLHVAVFDKATSAWIHASIARARPPVARDDPPWYLGSVLDIHRTAAHIYVDTHMNPSAGIVLVLTRDLRPVTTFFGWILHVLPNDFVLYHRSEVHFAPTHAAELWTYDGRTGRDTAVYPRKPYDAIRRRYPEQYDSSLQGLVVVSDDGKSIAFVMLYGDRDAPRGNSAPIEAAVVCRDMASRSPQCHETELSVLQRAHPGWPNAQILNTLVRSPGNR